MDLEHKREVRRKLTARRRERVKKLLRHNGYNSEEKLVGDLLISKRITKRLFNLIMTLERY
jgi:hypothetical protein